MDLEVIRTFVEIADSGSFKTAAARLNVTQSAVSMRVRQLEERLGQTLFLRSRTGIDLTAPGAQFHPHAMRMLQSWQRARQEAALPPTASHAVAVGGQVSLWDHLLPRWLSWMRDNLPDVAIRASVGGAQEINNALDTGLIDIAVIYSPQQRSRRVIETLFTEELVLAKTPDADHLTDDGFIYVDWGPEFAVAFAEKFINRPTPPVTVGIGLLGLQHILHNGGSGYFPRRLITEHVTAGTLRIDASAPVFERPAFLSYAADRDEAWFHSALDGMRRTARN